MRRTSSAVGGCGSPPAFLPLDVVGSGRPGRSLDSHRRVPRHGSSGQGHRGDHGPVCQHRGFAGNRRCARQRAAKSSRTVSSATRHLRLSLAARLTSLEGVAQCAVAAAHVSIADHRAAGDQVAGQVEFGVVYATGSTGKELRYRFSRPIYVCIAKVPLLFQDVAVVSGPAQVQVAILKRLTECNFNIVTIDRTNIMCCDTRFSVRTVFITAMIFICSWSISSRSSATSPKIEVAYYRCVKPQSSTADILGCLVKFNASLDKQIGDLLQSFLSEISNDDARSELQRSQETWNKFANLQCNMEASLIKGNEGTKYNLLCQINVAQKRIEMFERMRRLYSFNASLR